MGKASDLDRHMAGRIQSPQEVERREGRRPKLRLRPEVLDQALTIPSQVDIFDRLGEKAGQVVALHNAEREATAVVITTEQYLKLVTSLIRDRELTELNLDGRIAPSDATLAGLGVEQINPRDTWFPIPGYDPSRPPSEG